MLGARVGDGFGSGHRKTSMRFLLLGPLSLSPEELPLESDTIRLELVLIIILLERDLVDEEPEDMPLPESLARPWFPDLILPMLLPP